MGRSLDTYLVYGYKLGGQEGEWNLGLPYDEEEYRYTWPSWVKLDEEGDPDPEEDGFIEQADKLMLEYFLRKVGFVESEPDWEKEKEAWYAYLKRRNTAKATAMYDNGTDTLEIKYGGVSDYQDAYLGFLIGSGDTEIQLDLADLTGTLQAGRKKVMDEVLAEALNLLEVHPPEKTPVLYVIANYS
jgi:hypothetical protein